MAAAFVAPFDMSTIIQELERKQLREVPRFKAGDTVRVHFKVIEGTRQRVQVFEHEQVEPAEPLPQVGPAAHLAGRLGAGRGERLGLEVRDR